MSDSLRDHLDRIRKIKTDKRSASARANGRQPVKPGSRPRGRPRKLKDVLESIDREESSGHPYIPGENE